MGEDAGAVRRDLKEIGEQLLPYLVREYRRLAGLPKIAEKRDTDIARIAIHLVSQDMGIHPWQIVRAAKAGAKE